MAKTLKKYSKYIKKAQGLGAKEAKIIAARSIVVSEWVRLKCQFGCSEYGISLTCPPRSPAPEQTRKILKDYKFGMLLHFDGQVDIGRIVVKLERQIFLDGYYKALGLKAGPCMICKRCTLKFCRFSERARPSMEACGIDVYATARAHGFPIEVLRATDCRGNYYGLVLIE